MSIDIREAGSLALFENRIKTWKCEDCHVDLTKRLFKMSGISDKDQLVTDRNISITCSLCMCGIYAYVNVS